MRANEEQVEINETITGKGQCVAGSEVGETREETGSK